MNRSTPLQRLAAVALSGALLLTACSGETQSTSAGGDEDKNVNIGYIAWDENIANSFLWKELLEQQGYTVTLTQLEVAALYSGVSQGQLDIFMAATPRTHEDYWAEFEDQFEVVGQWYDTLIQGVAVPDYVDMDTLEDLAANPEAVGGQIVGIEPGTGLMRQLKDNAVSDYGLDGLKILDGSTPAMLAALDKAITEEEPIAVTLWQPHWAFNKYPVQLLEDTEGSFGENDTYKVIASKEFNGNTEVIDQLARFHMEPEELESLELTITEAGQGKEQEAVREWIADNEDVVNEWTEG
ncbi:glycine betaine ABC transporter substrate-binding protein [Ornithinimicrobium cavernae]|uniref:glycine betaine ABC transporter substrate-binding protein n=1 Tax=Ornithinimicrobium cavernae TaxID=2666047 RepID=UPI00137A4334|nr:glycine betaine ABC transporter substrate-binding protein [Ornithinimicrobium cavernae]